MKPGLYRNVSSIFIRLSEKYNNYNLLLDCGEGSYQQLHHHFGEKKTNEIMDKLKLIFLSHKHGDHMLGTLKIILEIEKIKKQKKNFSFEEDKVYIVAPKTLIKWIKRNIQNEASIVLKELFILIDNRQINPNINSVYSKYIKQNNPYKGFSDVTLEVSEEFLKSKTQAYFELINGNSQIEEINSNFCKDNDSENFSSDDDCVSSNENIDLFDGTNCQLSQNNNNKMNAHLLFSKSECRKISEFYKFIQNKLGINFFAIEVFHCDESFGCILEHSEFSENLQKNNRNWKISYSGDTRPCNNFHNFAAFSSVFIHEATFDDELMNDAKEKMHSTIAESIKLGLSCKSWRIALTHFSPRYIKLMPIKDEYLQDKVVFTNDYFSLKLSDFKDAYKTGKRIASLLELATEKQIL